MAVVAQLAPPPTGILPIGRARIALFSWLHARRHDRKFHPRIEDTDERRSIEEAIEAVFDRLERLELKGEGGDTVEDRCAAPPDAPPGGGFDAKQMSAPS